MAEPAGGRGADVAAVSDLTRRHEVLHGAFDFQEQYALQDQDQEPGPAQAIDIEFQGLPWPGTLQDQHHAIARSRQGRIRRQRSQASEEIEQEVPLLVRKGLASTGRRAVTQAIHEATTADESAPLEAQSAIPTLPSLEEELGRCDERAS